MFAQHPGWRGPSFRSLAGSVVLLSVTIAACSLQRDKASLPLAGACPPVTSSTAWVLGPTANEDSAFIARVLPRSLGLPAGAVLYADTTDLDCNGTADLLVQWRRPPSGSDESRVELIGYVATDGRYREVLSAASVNGREVLAIAANLTGTGKRDLVTISYDEGGYAPHVFRWVGDRYARVRVPERYFVRQEEDWSTECRERVSPRLLDNAAIQLVRETISPNDVRSHGANCDLPLDTLQIQGDSLGRASSRR